MPMLDVFKDDLFGVVSLTDAIIKAPYQPGRIGTLGLFRARGITTTTAVVEEKDGVLSLIQSSPRGGPASQLSPQKRRARAFVLPHLERDSTIMADEVQNVRAFGSENATQAVQDIVNERLAQLRAMHEVTLEHLRVGAIQGKILDADGSELFDLFTEFGVEQQTAILNLAGDIRNQAVAIERQIETELGGEPITGYRAFCGNDFFDELTAAASVQESLKFQESIQLRTDLRKGFDYGGITWENYRGKVGNTEFFATDEAYVVPIGTSVFSTYFAPADFLETVNTVGLPVYAKQTIDPEGLNRFVRVHSQSNPLALNLRPRSVVKVTLGT